MYIDTILDELKSEIEETIKATGNYSTTPTVARGPKEWGETDGKRPIIWYTPIKVNVEQLLSETFNCWIEVEMQGYADADGYGNSDKMYRLFKDIHYFLLNDYTRQMYVVEALIGEGSLYEESGQSGFQIIFNIYVSVSTTTLQVV